MENSSTLDMNQVKEALEDSSAPNVIQAEETKYSNLSRAATNSHPHNSVAHCNPQLDEISVELSFSGHTNLSQDPGSHSDQSLDEIIDIDISMNLLAEREFLILTKRIGQLQVATSSEDRIRFEYFERWADHNTRIDNAKKSWDDRRQDWYDLWDHAKYHYTACKKRQCLVHYHAKRDAGW